MASGVPSGLKIPVTVDTEDISIDDNAVVHFKNFAVNSATPKPAHRAYCPFLINFVIQQLDALGYKDKVLKVPIVGEASATGTVGGNSQLGSARATAIGQMLKNEFDRQKGKSGIARAIEFKLELGSLGDSHSRKDRETRLKGLIRNEDIDKMQNSFREAKVGFGVIHVVEDDDMDYQSRMVYNVKLETKKVPANQLEQVIDDLEKKLGGAGTLAKLGFDQLKTYVLKTLKETVKPLFEDFPEIAIVYETIDFIVPSDLNLCFQFKDNKETMSQYHYTGAQNKKSLDLFDILGKLIGLLKWMTKVEEALEKVDKLGKMWDQASAIVKKLKQATGYLKKALDDLLKKDGYVRKYFGDAFADSLLSILSAGTSGPLVIVASGWYAVSFQKKSVYAVSTFGGGARTDAKELLGKSVVTLDFLLDGSEALHHYRATTVIHGEFSIQTGMLGYGFSTGLLRIM
jgi:hypothetical protein